MVLPVWRRQPLALQCTRNCTTTTDPITLLLLRLHWIHVAFDTYNARLPDLPSASVYSIRTSISWMASSYLKELRNCSSFIVLTTFGLPSTPGPTRMSHTYMTASATAMREMKFSAIYTWLYCGAWGVGNAHSTELQFVKMHHLSTVTL